MEQQNPYIKQYPELLAGKTILYVHGFASSGQSGTVSRLREVFPKAKVVAPDLPLHPDEALALLRLTCEEHRPDLIIGTSMGGMYTEKLYGYDRICVNPAMEMAETMKEHGMIGAQQFQNPRRDGVQEFIATKALVKEYKAMTDRNFEGINADERRRVWGLFGDADTTVDTFGMFSTRYPQSLRFHGEHRMNDKSFMHSVVPVIRWIDDAQERRQRPIIYIGIETLMDAYRKPTSSMMKAVRFLLERYQVYFVCPSSVFSTALPWLEEHVNVPAWRHVVCTDRRDLLYGDYLVERGTGSEECGAESEERGDNALATLIDYGSDTFKTWEDIIDYFSRLGGQ